MEYAEYQNIVVKVEPVLDINDNCREDEELSNPNTALSDASKDTIKNLILAADIKTEPELIIEDVSTIEPLDVVEQWTDVPKRLAAKTKDSRCDICSKPISKSYMKRHIRLQHPTINTNRYKCRLCQESFKKVYQLNLHILTHKNSPEINRVMFHCDICNKSFMTLNFLRNHMNYNHRRNRPKFTCKICGKEKYSSNMQQHMDMHLNIKRYTCDICHTSYGQVGNYYAHMNLHTGEKQYKCDKCGNVYLSLSYFKKHLNIHTREKTHKCPLCDKVFVHISHHKRHINNVHTRAKSFTCEPCGKIFFRLCNLKEHMMAKHC